MGPPGLVESFRRVADDDVAKIADRSHAGEQVPDQEWAHVFTAFGPHLPDQQRHARTPKNLEVNAHGMDLIRRLDILDQLSRVESPTLVSVGELDLVTPVAAAEEITCALPAGIARLEIIAEAGHFSWLDAPDRFWPIITEFVHTTAVVGQRHLSDPNSPGTDLTRQCGRTPHGSRSRSSWTSSSNRG
jgi:pimeloyl-ACP methyl ester carboxylesterase